MSKLSVINKVCLISGSFLVVMALACYILVPPIIEKNIHQNIIIQPGSKAYDFWEKPPAKIFRRYFLFDVANPNEVQKGIQKPILVERGPYTYSEVWDKKNVRFLGNKYLSFTPVVTLHFERDMSIGDESDMVTFLNVPVMGMIEIASKGRFKNIEQTAVDAVIRLFGSKLFETKTVGQLISGYNDPLMTIANILLPQVVKDKQFSLINGKNGTEWQNFTVMTGYDYASNVAQIISWDGQQELKFWYTDSANTINGTDGTFYSPFRKRDDVLYAYNADMCRSYKLVYSKDSSFNNLKTYEFHLPKDIFNNKTLTPENDGFCDPSGCLGNGVLNISTCYGGVSGFVSQPHFLNADQKFVDALIGMNPNEDIHDFVIAFEPTTGVPIRGNIRLQINFYMTKSEKIGIVKDIEPALLPMFWFDEFLELNGDTLDELKEVALIVSISNIAQWSMLGVGLALLLVAIVIYIYRRKSKKSKREERKALIPKEEEEVRSAVID